MNHKTIYALGFFDGVHLGHKALLQQCRAMAQQLGCAAGVITFTSHPDTLVLGKTPALINTIEDRRRLLKNCGMDKILELPFDRALMNMPWQDFFALLVREYHVAGLVCGHDFRFGRGGEGNAALLQEACCQANIPCAVIPEQTLDGITLSSTYIRQLLEAGQVESANRFLGHPHILTGQVIPGKQLGRTINIPTANLALPEDIVTLRHGVYACKAYAGGSCHLAVTNIGTRPTVAGEGINAESWLLDFDGDLYGKTLTLEFYAFLRPEQKFSSLQQLHTEIQKNALQVRKFFENA